MSTKKLKIIGWKETVDLPDWGIEAIIAKSDTGARRSALDVSHVVELPGNQIQFDIVLDRKDRSRTKTVVAPIDHQTHVRSSNGEQHERYFVRTNVVIHGRLKEVEFSLVSRESMVCRILLGRKALEGDFLVDSSQKHVTGPRRKVRDLDE
ncbi:RimK/LysX family protein [Coraliomargarita algicola]|uniref:RimK/LysX family protein n=1 Tax=Coraliomargarita algicola TaxID=3092156 RepID=A0ABZ0RHP0_9BACT|nr:RimK/LysX family protein [Coraliomargarita sp. J2-16]WPJ95714.1 RimK/LysX family protein [Coraliomargarita sp. J2-16]